MAGKKYYFNSRDQLSGVRRIFILFSLLMLLALPVGAEVGISDGVRIFQYDYNSNINFSQEQNYSSIGIRNSLTMLGASNFSIKPKSSASAELDFYRPLAGRQKFVSNFTGRAETKQSISFNVTNLPSKDFYEAFFSNNSTRIHIGYTTRENWFNFSSNISNADISIFNYGEKGVEVNNVSFNDSKPVEDETISINVNLSNEGVVDTEKPNITAIIETYNGTDWIENETVSEVKSVPENSSITASLPWKVKPGPWNFNIISDPENTIKETNESNNRNSTIIDIESYQTIYGGSDSRLEVGSGNQNVYMWNPVNDRGNLYFYDVDSEFSFTSLEPLSSSDLVEADEALKMRGHNDSIESLWDANDDGTIDHFKSMEVGARSLNVPVINSTEGSDFETGLLYDSGDGSPYNGTQDLVLITEMEADKTGKYGSYDYEVKLPFYLGELRPGSDKVEIYQELK